METSELSLIFAYWVLNHVLIHFCHVLCWFCFMCVRLLWPAALKALSEMEVMTDHSVFCIVHLRLRNKPGLPNPGVFLDFCLSFTPTSSLSQSPVSSTEIVLEYPPVPWAEPPSQLGTIIVVSSFPFLPPFSPFATWQLEPAVQLSIRSCPSLVKALHWFPVDSFIYKCMVYLVLVEYQLHERSLIYLFDLHRVVD